MIFQFHTSIQQRQELLSCLAIAPFLYHTLIQQCLIPKLTHTNTQQYHHKTKICTFVSFCHKNGFELHGYVAVIQELPLLSLTILYQNVNLICDC
ncbi:hypothetical protein PN463_02110 [Dolichospermum circinale CS-537/03]|uniref:hypothetical protein n=1 Tax=Dolichospermum circinale TaxID=109265 RepID=UPI0004220275|nr:hypothetical protein [Dolichospermum circinale]MDB9477412.1 hypothetical protein [Dolichospermum circinale CS-537/03]